MVMEMESEMERIFEIRMAVELSNRRKWITWRAMEKIWYAHGIWMVRENSSLSKYFKLQMRCTRVYRMFRSFPFPFSFSFFFWLSCFKRKTRVYIPFRLKRWIGTGNFEYPLRKRIIWRGPLSWCVYDDTWPCSTGRWTQLKRGYHPTE